MPKKQSTTGDVEGKNVIVAETAIFHASVQLGADSQPPESSAPPPTLRRLPPRSEKFAGRQRELGELHERLSRSCTVGVTQEMAVRGEGGIGKTSLAIEYAWKHLKDYPGGAYLLPCDTDLLLPAIVDLAEPLGLPSEDDQERIAARVKTRASAHGCVRAVPSWMRRFGRRCLRGSTRHGLFRIRTTQGCNPPANDNYCPRRKRDSRPDGGVHEAACDR